MPAIAIKTSCVPVTMFSSWRRSLLVLLLISQAGILPTFNLSVANCPDQYSA
jgi:hypothetical protein